MAVGFPVKANYATGDILTATNMNDLAGTLNSITSDTLSVQAGKNALINGGFDIWQRGTSFTGSNYSADRWLTQTTAGTTTFARESTTVPTDSQYAMKWTQASASAYANILQAIETANAIRFAGKSVTISAQVASSASVGMTLDLFYATTVDKTISGAGWTQITPTSGGSATPTNTTYSTVTGVYAVPSTAKSLMVGVTTTSITAGTTFYVSKVQLELGSTATTFSRAGGTLQGELAACQRYYWRSGGDQAYQTFGTGSAYSTTQSVFIIPFPVTMRDVPTTIDYNALGVKGNPSWTPIAITSANNFNGNSGSKYAMNLYTAVASGLTSGNYYSLVANNSTSAYLGFGAEL